MGDVTHILKQVSSGCQQAANDLLPLVYDELRALAAARMSRESSGQTLQPTALVHEAYVRLVSGESRVEWNGRGHFFGAAAEAMRRILIDRARQKNSLKGGGQFTRVEMSNPEQSEGSSLLDLIALDEALCRLENIDSRKAELVKLKFFAGLTTSEAAEILKISVSTAENDWAYARCWLRLEMLDSGHSN